MTCGEGMSGKRKEHRVVMAQMARCGPISRGEDVSAMTTLDPSELLLTAAVDDAPREYSTSMSG